jgi:sensor histidine kinase regulating citrate/malate metabolism
MTENAVHVEIERLLRLQRHDFINHIQVIQALLQLGKTDRALGYIDDMVKSPEMTGNLIEIYLQRPGRE